MTGASRFFVLDARVWRVTGDRLEYRAATGEWVTSHYDLGLFLDAPVGGAREVPEAEVPVLPVGERILAYARIRLRDEPGRDSTAAVVAETLRRAAQIMAAEECQNWMTELLASWAAEAEGGVSS